MSNKIFVMLLAMFVVAGCTRYYHYIGTSIGEDKAILSFQVGYHLVASSSRDEDEFIEALLVEDLKSIQLCSDGYVIDSKSRSRHGDFMWYFHCK